MPSRILTVTGTAAAAASTAAVDDVAEQVDAPRQRRAAALAGHLGHRAAEVEVDVVGQILLDDHPHRRPTTAGSTPYSWRLRGVSSGANRISRSVFG